MKSMINNKRYVCYVVHAYTDFNRRDKKGYIIPTWHYDALDIAYFTNQTKMKKWMRKQMKKFTPSPEFYIYLEGESKVYEKYGSDGRILFKLTSKSPLDSRRPTNIKVSQTIKRK